MSASLDSFYLGVLAMRYSVCALMIFLASPPAIHYGQDASAVKQAVLVAIDRCDNLPAVVITGTYKSSTSTTALTMQIRGNSFWQEETSQYFHKMPVEEQEADVSSRRQVTKCELPLIDAFDGKKSYKFNPFTLILKIEPASGKSGSCSAMQPKGWNLMSGHSAFPLRSLAEGEGGELQVEQLKDGRWRLSQAGLGGNLPEATRKELAVWNRSIVVDPKVGYHIVEYEADGAIGMVSGVFEWEKQDGFWFPCHGKHMNRNRLSSEWKIDKISFDAKNCRARFDEIEQIVPFATQIDVYDGNRKRIETRFKGGKAGEEEHKLIKLALLKNKISGE